MVIPSVRKLPRTAWFLMAAALVLLCDGMLSRSGMASEGDKLVAYAVMFDCMAVIPLLYWLFVIKRTGKPLAALLPFPILGALAAWLLLPKPLAATVWNAFWPVELLLGAAEAALVFYELRLIYRVVKRFPHAKRETADVPEALRLAIMDDGRKSKLASLLLHDATFAYYLLFSWRRKRVIPASPSEKEGIAERTAFTYHRQTNQIVLAAVLTNVIAIESLAVHLLIGQWSQLAAWIVTMTELWLLLLIWADCRASVLQPVKLAGGMLRLRYGLRIQADIPLERMASIASAREYLVDKAKRRTAAEPIFGTPNVRIELDCPVRVEGLLFLPREVSVIYLAIDEPEAFVRACEGAMKDHNDIVPFS